MYKIEMQFIPGVENIWVLKLNIDDPIYEYDDLQEALAKVVELELADPEGRKYRVANIAET